MLASITDGPSEDIDKIEPVGDFFLVKWFKSVENLGSADSWAKTGIVCFLLFIGCLILFFFSRWVRLKKIGFYLGVYLLSWLFCQYIRQRPEG